MSAPLGATAQSRETRSRPAAAANGQAEAGAASGRRLLLVEDEALVGMMMKDTLTEMGFAVIGPFNSIAAAMPAARQDRFSAAVLDINVNGELIYDLADVIVARDIPLVFVTGYGSEAIEKRFERVPTLQKPIDKTALERVLVAHGPGVSHVERRPVAVGNGNA
jgi:DNA-binding NtrC family response regulator